MKTRHFLGFGIVCLAAIASIFVITGIVSSSAPTRIFAQSSSTTTTPSSSANSGNSAPLASSSLFLSSSGNLSGSLSKQSLQQTTLQPISSNATTAVATNTIRIPKAFSVENGRYYSPVNAKVPVGSNVTWINDDFSIHTATASGSVFDTGNINPGASGSATIRHTGVTTYFCGLHPWMTGTIVAFSPNNQAQQQNAASSSTSGIAPGYKLQPSAQPQPLHGSGTTPSSPTGIPGIP